MKKPKLELTIYDADYMKQDYTSEFLGPKYPFFPQRFLLHRARLNNHDRNKIFVFRNRALLPFTILERFLPQTLP